MPNPENPPHLNHQTILLGVGRRVTARCAPLRVRTDRPVADAWLTRDTPSEIPLLILTFR